MKMMVIAAVLATALALAGCNTVEGVGRDVESVGKTVSDAAN